MKGSRHAVTPRRVADALRLRHEGKNWDEIGAALRPKCKRSQAHRLVKMAGCECDICSPVAALVHEPRPDYGQDDLTRAIPAVRPERRALALRKPSLPAKDPFDPGDRSPHAESALEVVPGDDLYRTRAASRSSIPPVLRGTGPAEPDLSVPPVGLGPDQFPLLGMTFGRRPSWPDPPGSWTGYENVANRAAPEISSDEAIGIVLRIARLRRPRSSPTIIDVEQREIPVTTMLGPDDPPPETATPSPARSRKRPAPRRDALDEILAALRAP